MRPWDETLLCWTSTQYYPGEIIIFIIIIIILIIIITIITIIIIIIVFSPKILESCDAVGF